MPNAILIDGRDNTAVVLEPVPKGQTVCYTAAGCARELTALQDIPVYHKVAVRAIPAGSPVVKYGEHIGAAAEAIPAGSHVHTHNVLNVRERL